jgi:hypothetical protein
VRLSVSALATVATVAGVVVVVVVVVVVAVLVVVALVVALAPALEPPPHAVNAMTATLRSAMSELSRRALRCIVGGVRMVVCPRL